MQPSSAPVFDRRFRAMGSDCHLVVVGGTEHLIETARRRIDQLERRWSRFIGSSEICELNRRSGEDVIVSPDTALLIQRAIEAWRLTGGGFDPTVLGAVVRAGYDVSFEQISGDRTSADRDLDAASVTSGSPIVGCTDIRVDGRAVHLPLGIGFDPGGIGKGLAADLVIGELLAAGVAGACVNLGGDLRVAGSNPTGDAWTIAIEHPSIDAPIALLGLHAGAVATSTTLRRRWSIGGAAGHHLIDPTTGLPSETDLELTTVIAAEAWVAEVLAKAVLLRGAARAFDVVDDQQVQALTVDAAGLIRTTSGFQLFAGDEALPSRIDELEPVEARS